MHNDRDVSGCHIYVSRKMTSFELFFSRCQRCQRNFKFFQNSNLGKISKLKISKFFQNSNLGKISKLKISKFTLW